MRGKESADSLLRQFRLEEVEVRAKLERNVIAPQSLTDSSLLRLSSLNVADAVRYFSGVSLKDYGGIGGMKTVDIRSMGTHHLGVFYDGVEIGNAQNGVVDLGKFSVDNLESIELYNGQKSETFQPAKDFGSSGTLYLRTRKPRFPDAQKYHIEARMRAGTFALVNPSLLYEQRLTSHLSLSFNTEYSRANGRYHFRYRRNHADGTPAWDTTAVRENGDVEAIRVEMGLYGLGELPSIRGDYQWNVRGYYYQAERGIPGAIVNNVWQNSQRQWDRNAFVQGNISFALGRKADLQAIFKYSNDKLRYLNPDSAYQIVDDSFLQQEVYASVSARYRIFPIWDIAIANDYQLNWLRSDKVGLYDPKRHTVLTSLATSVNYEWFRLMASVLSTYIQDETTRVDIKRHTYHAFTPSVVLNTRPIAAEDWYIRAFYKLAYRMPTFNDLYYQEMGVSDLKPEKTRQYDLGTEWSHNWRSALKTVEEVSVRLRADGYFNQVENKIIAVPKGNSQYRWMMTNLGYVEIWGAETGADIRLTFPHDVELGMHATYTYQRALDCTDPKDNHPYFGTYRKQIAYIPQHSCSATASLSWKGLMWTYSYIYVGERYTSSAHTRENYVQPYYTHDMALSYLLNLRASRPISPISPIKPIVKGLQFGLEVNNIFNQQYEVIPNYPMPGIHGKGSVKIIL